KLKFYAHSEHHRPGQWIETKVDSRGPAGIMSEGYFRVHSLKFGEGVQVVDGRIEPYLGDILGILEVVPQLESNRQVIDPEIIRILHIDVRNELNVAVRDRAQTGQTGRGALPVPPTEYLGGIVLVVIVRE